MPTHLPLAAPPLLAPIGVFLIVCVAIATVLLLLFVAAIRLISRIGLLRLAGKLRPSRKKAAVLAALLGVVLLLSWRYVGHYCAVQVVWFYGGALQYEGGKSMVNVIASRDYLREKSGETLLKQFTGPVVELRSSPMNWPLPSWVLGYFPELTFLSLNDVECTDLKAVGELKELERLVLHASENLDHGIEHLQPLEKLQIIRINHPQSLSDVGAEKLSALPAVTSLWLESQQLSDDGLLHLGRLPLSDLIIDSRRVTDEGLVHLHDTPLTWLSVEGTSVSNDGILEIRRAIKNLDTNPAPRAANPEHAAVVESLFPVCSFELDAFGRVVSVRISSDSDMAEEYVFNKECALQLAGLPDLREASIEGDGITDEVAPLLEHLANLEELELQETALGPAGLASLLSLPKLSGIRFRDCPLDSQMVSALSSCPHLRSLGLKYVDLEADLLAEIAGLDSLTQLSLSSCGLTDDLLAGLDLPATLERLDLSCNRLTGDCLDSLKALTGLQELAIYYNEFDKRDLTELQEALPHCSITSEFSDDNPPGYDWK